ncbi:hypothetical protein TruAng_002526 [Truncatella angustata]|nr:hypothetical protein TruAng_002526 [Truncatella angustata]
MFYEKDLRDLRDELKGAKQNIVLINSVNQIALSMNDPVRYNNNCGAMDEMRVMLQLIYDNQHRGVTTLPSQETTVPLLPIDPVYGHEEPPYFTPNRGFGVQSNQSNQPNSAEQAPSQPNFAPMEWPNAIMRVHRNMVSVGWLKRNEIRWVNDPYESSMIDIHDKLSATQFQYITNRAKSHPAVSAEGTGNHNVGFRFSKGQRRNHRTMYEERDSSPNPSDSSLDASNKQHYARQSGNPTGSSHYSSHGGKGEKETKYRNEDIVQRHGAVPVSPSRLKYRRGSTTVPQADAILSDAMRNACVDTGKERRRCEKLAKEEGERRKQEGHGDAEKEPRIPKSPCEPPAYDAHRFPGDNFSDSSTFSAHEIDSCGDLSDSDEEEYIDRLASAWATTVVERGHIS